MVNVMLKKESLSLSIAMARKLKKIDQSDLLQEGVDAVQSLKDMAIDLGLNGVKTHVTQEDIDLVHRVLAVEDSMGAMCSSGYLDANASTINSILKRIGANVRVYAELLMMDDPGEIVSLADFRSHNSNIRHILERYSEELMPKAIIAENRSAKA